MKSLTEYEKGIEVMRAHVLGLINDWLTNSNAAERPDAVNVLQTLAAEVEIAKPLE